LIFVFPALIILGQRVRLNVPIALPRRVISSGAGPRAWSLEGKHEEGGKAPVERETNREMKMKMKMKRVRGMGRDDGGGSFDLAGEGVA